MTAELKAPLAHHFSRLKPNLKDASSRLSASQATTSRPSVGRHHGLHGVPKIPLGYPWTHGQRPSLEWNRTIPGIKGSHTHDWFTTQLTMLYDGFEPSGPGGAFLGYTEHSFC